MFYYQRLAKQITEKIDHGELEVGDKLLSIRQFAHQHQVSINTAKGCYQLLEANGKIVVKQKSGYYVAEKFEKLIPPEQDFTSYPREVSNLEILVEIQQTAIQPNYINLGTIQLDPEFIPVSNLRRSLNRALKHAKPEDFLYCDRRGHAQLIQALVEHWREDGLYIDKQDVFISSGCLPAIALLIQVLTQENDSIIVPCPTFNGHLQLIANLNRQIIEIPASGHGIDLERLEQVMQSGQAKVCLLTANFQNPLGYCLTHQQKQDIAQCAARYQCMVIEDDFFAECGFDNVRPLPIKYWDKNGYVIWCGSISKSISSAYRVGWFCIGEQSHDLKTRLTAQNPPVSTPLQLGLADFIHSRAYHEYLCRLRPKLKVQIIDYIRFIREIFDKVLIEIRQPEGGYVLWLKLHPQLDSKDVYYAAKILHINIVPGIVFSEDAKHIQYLRLNAGHKLTSNIKNALQKIATCCEHILAHKVKNNG